MQLNLPIFEQIKDCQNILIAGAGGGFDIYAGLPLYHDLCRAGRKVWLANYSFTDLEKAKSYSGYKEAASVYSISGKVIQCPTRKDKNYFPEGYLAEKLDGTKIYAFPKMGVKPIREAYKYLVQTLNLDAIILVDGGIDSIMQGDEEGCATILEDSVSLAALRDTDVKHKYLAAIGFGTELDDGLCHYRVLENIAALIKDGGFLGSCALTLDMPGFHYMRDAYQYCVSQPQHATSHITPRIIRAVEGEFFDETVFIQPLMNLYWFFKPNVVAARNKLLDPTFCQTNTWTDVTMVYRSKIDTLKNINKKNVPLPL